jgi:hypothetical protein
MGGRATTFALCILVVGTPVARAETPAPGAVAGAVSPASRVTVFAGLGYAYPVGSAETGTDTGDVSFGLVPLSIGGSYDLPRDWTAAAHFRYALNIPTLCANASDCQSSVGSDVAFAVGVGRALPSWRHFTTHVGLQVGWEWLTTRLSDAGVAATRSWNGPLANLDIFVDLKSRGPWSVGPALALDVGFFTHFDLEAPAVHKSGSADMALHAWPSIAFRIGRRL